jgi:hypothetical protein
MSTENEDLEKVRDDKCFPVARALMDEMAISLMPKDPNQLVDYKEIKLKTLSLFLDADLNVATEVSYIPQLILTVLSGLNAAVHGCAIPLTDEARYSEIASKILGILAKAQIPFGSLTPDELTSSFAPVQDQLNALFAEEKLSLMEVRYVMDQLFDSFKTFTSELSQAIENATRRAESKALGIDEMDDLTLKKLNDFLLKE